MEAGGDHVGAGLGDSGGIGAGDGAGAVIERAQVVAQEAAGAAEEEEVFELPGIGAKLTAALIEAGFDDLEKMAAAPVEELVKIDGIGEKTAEKIRDVAGRLMRGEEVEEGE